MTSIFPHLRFLQEEKNLFSPPKRYDWDQNHPPQYLEEVTSQGSSLWVSHDIFIEHTIFKVYVTSHALFLFKLDHDLQQSLDMPLYLQQNKKMLDLWTEIDCTVLKNNYFTTFQWPKRKKLNYLFITKISNIYSWVVQVQGFLQSPRISISSLEDVCSGHIGHPKNVSLSISFQLSHPRWHFF